MEILWLARQAKHRLFLMKKGMIPAAFSVESALYRRFPGEYDYERRRHLYRRSFINWDATPSSGREVPRRIFGLWMTGEELPEGPRGENWRGFVQQQEAAGIDVTLLTPETLDEWVVDGSPFHPAFPYLSAVHRSDYVRAYLMHHHGGGYADIKRFSSNWSAEFDRFADESLWLVGYPEFSTQWVAQLPRVLGRDLRRNFFRVPGGGAYVVRPDTTLTREWMAELHRRLDYYLELLVANPGGVRNELPKYPIGWNKLLAQILHPLALKYGAHIELSASLIPDVKAYR